VDEVAVSGDSVTGALVGPAVGDALGAPLEFDSRLSVRQRYTIDTVEAAFSSFLTTGSFEEAVVRAANLGDDADTVAAVSGALAGAYYGFNSIPQRWRSDLENEKQLLKTALRLAGLEKRLIANR
jgi:ADP-ribosyl-[dinitrogen reductase] hydrolase